MPINVQYADGSSDTVYYYDSFAGWKQEQVDNPKLEVRKGGIRYYVGLTTNIAHRMRTDLRVEYGGQSYYVMRASKFGEIRKSSGTFTIPSTALADSIFASASVTGGTAGGNGGGGGGGGAHRSYQGFTLHSTAASSGSGGSAGRNDLKNAPSQSSNSNNSWAKPGHSYSITIGGGGSGGTKGIFGYGRNHGSAGNGTTTADGGGIGGFGNSGGTSRVKDTTDNTTVVASSGGSAKSSGYNSRSACKEKNNYVYAQGGNGGPARNNGSDYYIGKANACVAKFGSSVSGGDGNRRTSAGGGGDGGDARCETYKNNDGYGKNGDYGNTGPSGSSGSASVSISYWEAGL